MQKYAKCTHCGKIGHIRPQCPLYLDAIASGALKRPESKPKRGNRHAPKKGGPNTPPHYNFMKNPKAKAFLSAFKSFMNDRNNSDEDNDGNKEESAVDDDGDKVHKDDDDEDLRGFLSMIGSLKDYAVGFLVPTSASFSVKSNVCSSINTSMDSFSFFFLFGIG